MERVVRHGQMVKQTSAMVMEWYNSGNVDDIMDLIEADTVAFGENQCSFLVGYRRIQDFLVEEMRRNLPCSVYKLRCNEQNTEEGVTVTAHLILKTAQQISLKWYNIMFMYRMRHGHLRLLGINVIRDSQHENMYKNVRSKFIHHRNQLEVAKNRTPGIVGETVSVCSVVHTVNDDLYRLKEYDCHFWQLLGYFSEEEFKSTSGDALIEHFHPDDMDNVKHDFTHQMIEQGDVYQLEYRLRCRDDSYIWVLECGQRILDRNGRPEAKAIITDISTLKNTHDELLYRASYDEMTGVYNKRTFYRKARELMIANPDKDFKLLRMNVARFKVINELLGENEGDKLLKDIGSFLQTVNLPYFVAGRLYSDHFVICFSADDHTVERIMYSLRYIASSFNLRHRTVLNFGLYHVDDIHIPVSAMCDRANIALSRAKKDITNPYCEYDDEMRRLMVVEQEILNVLDKALNEKEFLVYLQPKYEIKGETLIGAEALVRWKHYETNMYGEQVSRFISPGDFVPVFERNGLIYDLDKYIWEETCRLLWQWQREGLDVKPISVNVSRVDLYDPGLVDFFIDLRRRYDIPNELLELELTESAYTNDPLQIIQVTDKLKDAGFAILMDDFGSGYSSLNMLKDVHVDVLKLDMGFLDSSDQSGRGGNILNAVVGMAHNLNLQIIAEGVENKEQVEFLRSIGCYMVQGYYYSKPLPAEEYGAKLKKL